MSLSLSRIQGMSLPWGETSYLEPADPILKSQSSRIARSQMNHSHDSDGIGRLQTWFGIWSVLTRLRAWAGASHAIASVQMRSCNRSSCPRNHFVSPPLGYRGLPALTVFACHHPRRRYHKFTPLLLYPPMRGIAGTATRRLAHVHSP